MKKWHKITVLVTVAVIGLGIIGYGSCWGLVYAIRESNSCKQFNIDNIEVRTGIDIPSIHRTPDCFSCILDKEMNTKINYFKIRTDEIDMDKYLERNSFLPVNKVDLNLSVFEKLTKIPEITSDNIRNYHYNAGKGKQTDWLAIVDKNSGNLWIYMKYKT